MNDDQYWKDLRAAIDFILMLHTGKLGIYGITEEGTLIYTIYDPEEEKQEAEESLKRAVYAAISKYPHLRDALLSDLASNEALVGTKIHNEYWAKG